MIVGVLVELSNKSVDKIFDYKVPSLMIPKIRLGVRVKVPFGRQQLEGFILEIKENVDSDFLLKEVIEVIDDFPVLNEELIFLGKKMQYDTLSTLISCYQVMLPKALKAKDGVKVSKKYDTYYKINRDVSYKFNDTQKKIISLFKNNDLVNRSDLINISISSLNTLVKNGVLSPLKKEHYRVSYSNFTSSIKNLTDDQQKVVDQVDLSKYYTYLLYGVTGSGKTEVYIKLIDMVLKKGKTAIVLVPEISLTPQMVSRFQSVFGLKIAALHSALSDGEKYDEWRRIQRGEASIVIGARSAIFAPIDNIGIIIVDEEHSDSYKQSDSNPRYHAIDIAKIRAQYHNCPVLLGSATPTLEAYARAKRGVYKLLSLPNRVNGKGLPDVKIVDMNKEIRRSIGHFSSSLIDSMTEKLSRREQVILLLNRRGYASFVTCKNCGYTFKCPNCDITLTYHKTSNTMRCHYCGYGEKVYHRCPSCGDDGITDLGVGTQKIEEELLKIFPDKKVLRMDIDTTSRKGAHTKMIEAFKNHEYDILLGTQMVAKGLDFPDVTLVGVINADTTLNIPDFRSSEHTFSLLSQVAGRSGRSEKQGKVIIQTFNPSHYAIGYTKNHDYIGFYNQEMKIRKMLKYPPYYYICYIKISGRDADYIFRQAVKIKNSFDRNLNYTTILGPSPCNIFKVNNIYRYSIILKYKKEDNLYLVINKIISYYKDDRKVRIDVDFNPSQIS